MSKRRRRLARLLDDLTQLRADAKAHRPGSIDPYALMAAVGAAAVDMEGRLADHTARPGRRELALWGRLSAAAVCTFAEMAMELPLRVAEARAEQEKTYDMFVGMMRQGGLLPVEQRAN